MTTIAIFALTAQNQSLTVVDLVLKGGIGFAMVPGLQMRVMRHAPDAPTRASGLNIASFNAGNAFGAFTGGAAIAAGHGYTSPMWIGAGFALAAFVVLLAAKRLTRDHSDAVSPTRTTSSTHRAGNTVP